MQCGASMGRLYQSIGVTQRPKIGHFGPTEAIPEVPQPDSCTAANDVRGNAYSITSSARASSLSGTVRPSIVAVWELMTSSNLLDCTTGKSAGLAPLRMRPA